NPQKTHKQPNQPPKNIHKPKKKNNTKNTNTAKVLKNTTTHPHPPPPPPPSPPRLKLQLPNGTTYMQKYNNNDLPACSLNQSI
ncbi:hypothetical protein ACLI1Y_17310, partial [Enterococcus faecalis]